MSRCRGAIFWIGLIVATVPAKVGRLDEPEIREASGLVKSRRHPGIFWTLNDSGNRATLFAVRADGSSAGKFPVAALNIDWESIAIDDSGHLYVGDIGNNDGRLPIRAIHRVAEPDPNRPAVGKAVIERSTYYRFAPGERFDAEALAIVGEKALIVSKRLDGGLAELFELPLKAASPLDPVAPRRLGALEGFREPATGADLSPDGTRLAVCSYEVARVYRKNAEGTWRPVETARFEHLRRAGIESIAWDGDDLLLAGENRDVFRWSRSPSK